MNPAQDFRRRTMKRTAFGSLFALALAAGAAQAQVVGGGGATLSGGGDDMTTTYSTGGAGGTGYAPIAQAGRTARFVGGQGDGPLVEYSAPPDTNPGREAWLLSGGDNAEVVYRNPH
jgi:hypothetical protein